MMEECNSNFCDTNCCLYPPAGGAAIYSHRVLRVLCFHPPLQASKGHFNLFSSSPVTFNVEESLTVMGICSGT
ncbi:unnamed protein product [Pleuronectes platessa]|uniref:Uncharacterized protein n=1 Tax=Pleuronectes platessa TaxID=8262 RepID=A0A9N7U2W1_PLEPL|nr:unnamed protein product [Pleuronectes platessa]